jgi:hypothetical protein
VPWPQPRCRFGGAGIPDRFQSERHVTRRLEALLGPLLEATPDDPLEPERNAGLRELGRSSLRIAVITSAVVPPVNGRFPESIS